MNPLLTKSKDAEAAIAGYRFLKPGAADHSAVQADAAADSIIGISDALGAAGSGSRVDVIQVGIAELELGGTVTRGDFLTSDANGMGVAAATGNRIGARAEVSGVAGDIIPVKLVDGIM